MRGSIGRMNVRAIVCCRCGGPLTNPEALPALVDCLYCGTVNAVSADAAPQDKTDVTGWEARKKAVADFTQALVAALNEGQAPFEALRASSAAHLGLAGRADTVARISLALARDFEREANVKVVRDPLVLSRIANVYLVALEELRTSDSYDLNLPFLTANETGPAHFQRKVTAKLLAELATRDPDGEAVPSKDQLSTVPAAKKKGWWPFS